MVWKFAALLIASCLALGGAAKADVTPICFDPGTARLSPDGYLAIRSLVAEQGGTQARAHIRLFTGDGKVEGVVAQRLGEARLEFANNGLFYGRVETVETSRPAPENCVAAEVVGLDPSRQAPPYFALWHHYGPFFDSGSDAVSSIGRESLRFLMPDYEPGITRFIIEGHSDTRGSADANMRLSQRRAENVALELVRLGVRWDDLDIRWAGERKLARPTADDVAEPLNRRVTIDARRRPPNAAR